MANRFTFQSQSSRQTEPQMSGAVVDDSMSASTRPAPNAIREVAEMAERSPRRVPRFRSNIPNWFSVTSSRETDVVAPVPRPSSSVYSGAVDPRQAGGDVEGDAGIPKMPQYHIAVQRLPSPRLHLSLDRSWSIGSTGPAPGSRRDQPGVDADRLANAEGPESTVTAPPSAMTADGLFPPRGDRRRRTREAAETRPAGSEGRRRRRHRERPPGGESAIMDPSTSRETDEERRQRRRRRRRERGYWAAESSAGTSSSSRRTRSGPSPEHFLFCFPWIQSREIRTQVLRCFVSGLFLVSLLAVYLALSVTRNITSSEFTVLLILIILCVTIFFCHGLIRLCLLIVKGQRTASLEEVAHRRGAGGYAIPRQPIRVVLARDEEAAGIESETVKVSPPAYGLWRESVRVDPNRIYWARNNAAAEHAFPPRPISSGTVHRPPSYVSDDGVSYVVEAQPRSVAPTTTASLAHPSESGRAGRPPGW